MAAASLVATAIGVLLLILTGYLLAAGMITLNETMVTAGKEMTVRNTRIMGTSIHIHEGSGENPLFVSLNNTGSEVIRDYAGMDVYLQYIDNMTEYYPYNPDGGRGWSRVSIVPDTINPASWDPGETLLIQVTTDGGPHTWVKVTTSNGASSSAYI
jgi:hypothetical protein